MKTETRQDAICRVCGTALGAAAVTTCEDCLTPHHADCWEYNGGCATYACPSGHQNPRQSAPVAAGIEGEQTSGGAPANAAGKPLDKIPFPSLQAGAFLGLFHVTLPTAVLTIFAEIQMLTAWGIAPQWSLFWSIVMLGSILWAAMTAEVYNIDLKNDRISRSKLLLGYELLEWGICPLDTVEAIELVRCEDEGTPKRKLVCRLRERPFLGDLTFDLTPTYDPGSPDDFAVDELLYRVESGSNLPVCIAHSLARMRRSLAQGIIGSLPADDNDPSSGLDEDKTTPSEHVENDHDQNEHVGYDHDQNESVGNDHDKNELSDDSSE